VHFAQRLQKDFSQTFDDKVDGEEVGGSTFTFIKLNFLRNI
jgi:hypothetical protein